MTSFLTNFFTNFLTVFFDQFFDNFYFFFQIVSGVCIPHKSYFERVYKTAHDHRALVIADETQTGLGRTGDHFWGFQRYGVVPDIVTVGRPLGAGHPIGKKA